MSGETSILGYWGYIPAHMLKKQIEHLDKKWNTKDEQVKEIDDRTKRNKDAIDELALRPDKESRKEFKREYGKDAKRVVKLAESKNRLYEKREAREEKIYKVSNPLIAKRIRIEHEIANLVNIQKKIEEEQEKIKQEIIKTNDIDNKNKLNYQLVSNQKELNKIMKKLAKLNAKLGKIMSKIDKMQDIIGDEFDLEEKFNEQMSGNQSTSSETPEENKKGKNQKDGKAGEAPEENKNNENQKGGKAGEAPEENKNNKNQKGGKAGEGPVDNKKDEEIKDNKEGEEPADNKKDEEVKDDEEGGEEKKETRIQKIKKFAKSFGARISKAWRSLIGKINAGLAGANNAMLNATNKSKEKLQNNVKKLEQEPSTFEEKRNNLMSELNAEIDNEAALIASQGNAQTQINKDNSRGNT